MKLWLKCSMAVVVIVVGSLAIAEALLERGARRSATRNGAIRDFHDVTAAELEQQIRNSLPIGSSRADVENYLSNQRMRYRNSTDEIDAAAPYIKGSNFVVRSTMGITFQFNANEQLQAIHTNVTLTGP